MRHRSDVCRRTCCADGGFELVIFSYSQSLVRRRYLAVWRNPAPLDNRSHPCVPACCGQTKNEPMTYGKIRSAEHLARGSSANQHRQLVLGRKRRDHFTCTGSVLVDQHHNTPVEWLRSEAFGHEAHRAIAVYDPEPEGHLQHLELRRRKAVEARKLLWPQAANLSLSREAVADRDAVGGQVAH